MKRLNVDINDSEYERLKEIANNKDVSIATLLGAFVQDLTNSDRCGGSDERDKASDWLHRNNFDYR